MRPLSCAVTILAVVVAASVRAGDLRLEIATPAADTVHGSPGHAFLAGRALSGADTSGRFDVVVVIDTSYSASGPSGADIDEDGSTGRRWGSRFIPWLPRLLALPNSDPGDSILAAEVAAARTLLAQLDARQTRVGVVGFSGDPRGRRRDARVEVPLTHRYEKVRRGLARLLADGPRGQTNIAAAVRLAALELFGGPSAASAARAGAERIVLFMTDGQPNLPLRGQRMENARIAVGAGRDAGSRGIRIDSFAIGRSAADDPFVTEGLARETGGVFTPVRDPRELVATFQNVRLADIDTLEVENVSAARKASYVRLESDGHFSALVPLVEGWNELRVAARTRDGAARIASVRVRGLSGAPAQPLSARLRERHTRLLEARLDDVQRRTLALATGYAAKELRALQLEIEATHPPHRRSLEIATGP